MNEGDGIGISHDGAVEVHNWKGEIGALQQSAHFADINHGGNAGRDAAGHKVFGLQPGLTQFIQGLPGKQTSHEEPIWNEGAAELDEPSRHIIDEMEIEDVKYGVESIGRDRQNFRGCGFKDFEVFDFARGANGGGNGFRINRNEAGAIELTGYGVQSFSEFDGYGMRKNVWPVEFGAFQSCEVQFTVENIFGTGRHRCLAEQGIVKHLPAFAIWGRDHAAFKNCW